MGDEILKYDFGGALYSAHHSKQLNCLMNRQVNEDMKLISICANTEMELLSDTTDKINIKLI